VELDEDFLHVFTINGHKKDFYINLFGFRNGQSDHGHGLLVDFFTVASFR
jgi:hypothetical protein